jgi:DNA modification methylase
MGTYKLHTGDVCAWSKEYSGASFHAVLSDFPYDLGFMGKDWDKNAQFKQWGESLIPWMYPGAIGLVFGGTRTWHRLATGMEDAGFEIWDTMMWLYGTGFPKGQDISKLIDKHNGDKRGR